MSDVFTKEQRSRIMSRIAGADTKPELLVRKVLHAMGYRFRLHNKKLPGKPDIVLSRHKKVIFVHGCFWHGHEGCHRSARPASNQAFWEKKLSGNTERDKRNLLELKGLGWKVLIVWACETKDQDRLTSLLGRFMLE